MGFSPSEKHSTTASIFSNIVDATDGSFTGSLTVSGTPVNIGISRGGPYALFRDEKVADTGGGTFTSGAWRTRDLNTVIVDEIGITLATNQVTLPAGTYRFSAAAPAYQVNTHQVRIRNITDGTTLLDGESSYVDASASSSSELSRVKGQFTITESKIFELQHRCAATRATIGFGVPGVAGEHDIEVYASIDLIKIA